MLQEILVKEQKLIFTFDLKNKKKFRLKKLQNYSIASSYSKTVKERELRSTEWYLEWQISYLIYVPNVGRVARFLVLTDATIECSNGKKAYPFELSIFLYHAIRNNLLEKEKLGELMQWITTVPEEEILENKLKPTIRQSKRGLTIKELRLIHAGVKLPFLMYKHRSGVWVEIILEKQQYAYGFQPMVYLCIPHFKFVNRSEWQVTGDHVDIFIDLFKIFGITSQRHKDDVLKILGVLKELLP